MIFNSLTYFIILNIIKDSFGDIFTDLGLPIFNDETERTNSDFTSWTYEGKVSANPIIFEPPFLDFYETPIGEPKWEQIKLISTLEQDSIHLLSVLSESNEFHCSTIKEQILLPKSNTTIDIIFLSRFPGKIKSTLQFHTSKGIFEYKIVGNGIPSPYRLISFYRLKLPLNETYSAPIYFHNPHDKPIQIVEMYTSGGDVHLEFPTNNVYYSKKVWIINPYETRTIMQVKIISSKIGNFTNFIRIRTNNSHTPLGFVLPIEIEISNKSSFYILTDKINFGIMRKLDTPKSIKIYVINHEEIDLFIEKIAVNKPTEAITVNYFTRVVVPKRKICIASVIFSAFKSTESPFSRGDIVIHMSNNQTYSIPYLVDVIHGSLIYDANTTKFYSTNHTQSVEKIIGITNTFDFPIAIYRISFPDKANNFLKMTDQIFPFVVKSKDVGFVRIKLNKLNNVTNSMITQFGVYTNVSLFMIPIFIYDGKLKVILHRPDTYSGVLDFGMVEMKTEHSLYFTIKNENPIDISINYISTNWYHSAINIVSVNKFKVQNKSSNVENMHFQNHIPIVLKPYQYVIFQLKVSAPDTLGVFANEIQILTAFENISIPYYLRTNEGSLNFLEFLKIEGCFPGKSSRKIAKVKSTFVNHLELTSIHFIPNDTQFEFEVQYSRNFPILINPNGVTQIGFVKYFPAAHCEDSLTDEVFVTADKIPMQNHTGIDIKLLSQYNDVVPCYVGFSLDSKIGYQWLKSINLNNKAIDYDHFIYKRLRSYWELILSSEKHNFNITLQMDTSNAKGFLNTVNFQMIWPSLLQNNKNNNNNNNVNSNSILYSSNREIVFPLTQIGNSSVSYLQFNNPSDKLLLVQLVFLTDYITAESTQKFIELFGLESEKIHISEWNSFSFHCAREMSSNEQQSRHRQIYQQFNVQPHNASLAFILQPRSERKIAVCFEPTAESLVSISGNTINKPSRNYLIVRNNLTSIELVGLTGKGSYGHLSFQNGHNQESLLLNFELTEKHLKNCDIQTKGIPSFTVRRPFVIKNIGRIPVYISGFKFAPFLSDGSSNDAGDLISGGGLSQDILGGGSSNLMMNDDLPWWDLNTNRDVSVITKPENTWCIGYGFEVVECTGYHLAVNQSLKLEIVFSPDFSLHKVVQQLQIHTSLSPWPYNVTVQASLPAYMLHRCSQALARPDSEILIWYMAIVVITLIFIAAMLISYYEADRIFTSNVIYRHFSSVALGAYTNNTTNCINSNTASSLISSGGCAAFNANAGIIDSPASATSMLFDLKACDAARNSLYSLYTNPVESVINKSANSINPSVLQDYMTLYNSENHLSTQTYRRKSSLLPVSSTSNTAASLIKNHTKSNGNVPNYVSSNKHSDNTSSNCSIKHLKHTNSTNNQEDESNDAHSSINYVRKKKKRSLLSSVIAWIMKYVTAWFSRNQVLKPKLDTNFYVDACNTNNNSAKTPKSNTTTNNNHTNNTTNSNNNSTINSNITNNNNSNHTNHNHKYVNGSSGKSGNVSVTSASTAPGKKSKNSFRNSNGINSTNNSGKYNYSIKTLDFDPINIPFIDNNSNNNNNTNNTNSNNSSQKTKKNAYANSSNKISINNKNKSNLSNATVVNNSAHQTQNHDDTLKYSKANKTKVLDDNNSYTDSSTDEKIKETENNSQMKKHFLTKHEDCDCSSERNSCKNSDGVTPCRKYSVDSLLNDPETKSPMDNIDILNNNNNNNKAVSSLATGNHRLNIAHNNTSDITSVNTNHMSNKSNAYFTSNNNGNNSTAAYKHNNNNTVHIHNHLTGYNRNNTMPTIAIQQQNQLGKYTHWNECNSSNGLSMVTSASAASNNSSVFNDNKHLNYDTYQTQNNRGQILNKCDSNYQYRKNLSNYTDNSKLSRNPSNTVNDSFKCDYDSDELIEWGNEDISNIMTDDISSLSERTEYFSMMTGLIDPEYNTSDSANLMKANPCHTGNNNHSHQQYHYENHMVLNHPPNCRVNNTNTTNNNSSNCNSYFQQKFNKLHHINNNNGTSTNNNSNGSLSNNNSRQHHSHYFETFSGFDPHHSSNKSGFFPPTTVTNASDQQPKHGAFMSLELRDIAQGRKQCLLDYERRCQIDSSSSSSSTATASASFVSCNNNKSVASCNINSYNSNAAAAVAAKIWEMEDSTEVREHEHTSALIDWSLSANNNGNHNSGSNVRVDVLTGCNTTSTITPCNNGGRSIIGSSPDGHLWSHEWNQIKTGSEKDYLAKKLIPTELFGENLMSNQINSASTSANISNPHQQNTTNYLWPFHSQNANNQQD